MIQYIGKLCKDFDETSGKGKVTLYMKLRHFLIITFVLIFAACGYTPQVNYTEETPSQIPIVEIDDAEEYIPDEKDNNAVTVLAIPDYTVNLEIFPDERIVNGVAAISFQNTSNYELDRVYLTMPLNAFAEGFLYPPFLPVLEGRIFQHGHEFGSIDITLATINLNPSKFMLDGTLLTIYLNENLPPEASIEIGLIFEAHIPRISHRTGGNDYAMWFGNFLPQLAVLTADDWHIYPYYPVGNPFFTTMSNYNVNITAPMEYTVVSTGFGVRNEGETNAVTSITIDQVRDFAFVLLSPAYDSRGILTETGVDITIHFRGNWDDDDVIDAILDTAHAAFNFFESRVGTHPYQSFGIVETELFIQDTMRYPGIMFVDARHIRTPAVHGSVVRDIGHQWFYNVVGNNPVTEPWLAYGLVSYLQLGVTLDKDAIATHMRGLHQSLQVAVEYMEYPELFRNLGYYTSWADFHRIQFSRGKLLFYGLAQRLGEEGFDQFVRTYYGRYAFSIATVQGLITVAEEIYGDSLEDFFNAWINSPTLPDID